MATITVPEKEIEICDFCKGGDKYLQKCVVCGKEYCLICKGIGTNPYHLKLCPNCIKLDEVVQAINNAVPEYRRNADDLEGVLKNIGIVKGWNIKKK